MSTKIKTNKKDILITNYLSSDRFDESHNINDLIFWNKYFSQKNSYTVTGFHQKSNRKIFKNAYFFNKDKYEGKIFYFLGLIKRILSIPNKNHIIFQTYEEISIFIFLMLRSNKKKIYLVASNNLTERRFKRKYIRAIYSFFDYKDNISIIVTCNSEKKFLSKYFNINKIHVKRIYLTSELIEINNKSKKIKNQIFYPGPEKNDKPIENLRNFYKSEFSKSLSYIIFNSNYSIIDKSNISKQINELVEASKLQNLIHECEFVFLPHSKDFSPKFSGNLVDALDNNCILISNAIEPVVSYFDEFGQLGIILDYESPSLPTLIDELVRTLNKDEILENISKARKQHTLPEIFNKLDELF